MKQILLAALLLLPGSLWAGNLDVNYIEPFPTKALGYSLVIPGSGYFYLAKHDPHAGFRPKGFLYLVLTAGLAAFTINKLQKDDHSVALGGAACFALLRMMEFGDVAEDAERSRARAIERYVKE